MLTEERFMTLHPEGKIGVNVSRQKYEVVRDAILETLHSAGEITFLELFNTVIQRLGGTFEGSIGWYVTTVKLDLEARGVIERITTTTPQRLRLAANQAA
jgi:hypothetical protein